MEVNVTDWPSVIAQAVIVRQRLHELDVSCIWSYPFPRLAAKRSDIDTISEKIGEALDSDYSNFLINANGWPKFYQDVDLFGTPQLLCSDAYANALNSIRILDDLGALRIIRVDSADIYPIAASEVQTDLFALYHGGEISRNGHVLWLAGELIEEFSSFTEFFLSMIDYQRRQISLFENSRL
jgi:hypothetical protein